MSKDKQIIAVVGMAGSGKSEAVNYLQKKYGWPKIYLGKYTFERMKAEGLELNNTNEKNTREKIRKELGMGAYAKLSLPEIKRLLGENDTVLIESHYSWTEYKIFKNEFGDNFKVLAIHASPTTRLKRLMTRPERPMKNKEDFEKRDYSEIENTEKGGPIARADYHIVNDQNINDLCKKIDKLIFQ